MTDLLVFDLLIGLLVISGISMAILGLYGRRFIGGVPAALPYVLLMFFTSAWAFLYAFDLLSPALPEKIFFHNLRFIVIPFIPLLELWLVVAYLRKKEWLRSDWAVALSIIPAIAVILALTSQYHTLFRYNFSINTSGPVPVLQYTESTFYQIYNTYIFLILVLAILILLTEARKQGRLWNAQTYLLLLALIIPMVVNYLFVIANISPVPGVNMTAPLLWVSALLYTIALFRYRFLDIVPIARSRLIETMATPMLVLDNAGRIIDMNPATSALFSITKESAMGRAVSDVVPDWPEFLHLCDENITCRYNLSRETVDRERFYTGSVEQLRTPSGEPEGRLVLLQDVTDLKAAERALRESEKKFSLAFRSSPYAITISRLSDGLIVDANDGFEHISGYRATDVIGKPAPDLDLWADPADRESIARDLENNVRVSGREYRFRTKSGSIITGLFSAEVITVRGTAYILSSINDITDRKQAEEQREELIGELRQKNAELDRFTYTVSHDLKNPLVTIQGFLGMLEEDMKLKDPAQAERDLFQIHEAAEKMETLISTLLVLSRSGRSVDIPSPVPFTDLAREAAGLLEASLQKRGVRLEIADSLPVVSGDRQRLLQVMINLIDNAVKFMGDQEEPVVEVGVETTATGPEFFIRDNGAGIKKEYQGKIFVLFERLDTKVPGTGVGLATVKKIIEAHGGRVWAESEGPGKGTTFRFTLPVAGNNPTVNNNSR
jgi:PAS domain S-box-containing protein